MAALTSLICFAFLGGGFSSVEFVARLTAPSEMLPFIGASMQVLGLIVAMIAGFVAALRPATRQPAPDVGRRSVVIGTPAGPSGRSSHDSAW